MRKRDSGAKALTLAVQVDLLTEALLESSGSNRSKKFAAILMLACERAEQQRQADHEAAMNLYPDLTPWCDDEEQVMGVWQNRLDVDTDSPEIPVGAERQYTYAPLDSILTLREVTVGPLVSRDPDPLVQGSDRTLPNDKQLVVLHDWEREEFLNARRPLGSAFQPGYDWQHGYRLDPRWVANESTLEREYGPMRVETMESHVVDPITGDLVSLPSGELQTIVEEVNRAGSTTWEYFRRNKVVPFRKDDNVRIGYRADRRTANAPVQWQGTRKSTRAGLPWIGTKEVTPMRVQTPDGYEGTVALHTDTLRQTTVPRVLAGDVIQVNIGGKLYSYTRLSLTMIDRGGRYVPHVHAPHKLSVAEARWLSDPKISKVMQGRNVSTFGWIRQQEKAYMVAEARKAQQRENIIALARKIGGDPRSPKFIAWVKDVGYDIAQSKLIAAYAKTKTVA